MINTVMDDSSRPFPSDITRLMLHCYPPFAKLVREQLACLPSQCNTCSARIIQEYLP